MNSKLLTRCASAWAITFCLCLCTVGCATRRPQPNQLEARVDQLFGTWNRPDSPGAAVVVVQDGAVVYQRGYGCANLDYGIPITPQTVFDAASVAKQFTGLAIAMLIDQGKLSLDDDIRTHLPEAPDFGTPITIRHLLHHTSGLRDWFETLVLSGRSPSDVITMDTILEMVRRQRDLDFAPGTEHSYSNTGYNLLAAIVSKVTGQSFRGWTDANLFQPLGMKHTHFCDDVSEIVTNCAAYYESQGTGGLRQFVSQLAAPGSSSLMTTAEDMGRWLLHFDAARIGETNAVLMMRQPGELISGARVDYGFGLGLGNYHGLRNVYHTGSWAGDCGMIWFPDKRFGVAVFANGPGVDPGRKTYDIANIYLNVPTLPKTESDRKDGSTLAKLDEPALTFEQLADYIGDYWSEELQILYRVEMRDRELTMGYGLSGWGKLLPTRQDRFETKPRPAVPVATTIEFTRGSTARVNGMKVSGGRVRKLQFSRVSLPKPESK